MLAALAVAVVAATPVGTTSILHYFVETEEDVELKENEDIVIMDFPIPDAETDMNYAGFRSYDAIKSSMSALPNGLVE